MDKTVSDFLLPKTSVSPTIEAKPKKQVMLIVAAVKIKFKLHFENNSLLVFVVCLFLYFFYQADQRFHLRRRDFYCSDLYTIVRLLDIALCIDTRAKK